jgi:hypothetical protein
VYTVITIRQITPYWVESPRTVPGRLSYRPFVTFEPFSAAA